MNPRGVRLLIIEALKNKTDAADRVYSPRDWPTTADMYPVLLVQTPIDVKNSLGRNVPQF
ncbi:ATP-binding protein, partial [Serratia ureilytica]|nr:ATP-binding protein [Serratia ureilytica]